MEKINNILAQINAGLDKIDLNEEIQKVKKDADKVIQNADKLTQEEGFNGINNPETDKDKTNLDVLIEYFKNASERLEKYDDKADKAELRQEGKSARDAIRIVREKKKVKENITGKYEELSRKKSIIEKYVKEYDGQELTRRQNEKIEANKNSIMRNSKRLEDIDEFSKIVSSELTTIENCLKLTKKVDEIEKLVKEIEDDENALSSLNPADPKDAKDFEELEEGIAANKLKLKQKCKDKDLQNVCKLVYSDNMTTMRGNISTSRGNITGKITEEKDKIKSRLQGTDVKDGYNEGFKEWFNGKIADAKDDEAFLKVFKSLPKELKGQNFYLVQKNKRISKNIEAIEQAKEIKSNGVELTEDEINARINEKLESRENEEASLPDLTRREKWKRNAERNQKIYDSLVKDNRYKTPWLHPIKFFKSKFDRNTREVYEEGIMREEAISEITTEKENKLNDILEVPAKSFQEKLFVHVMGAKADSVKDMVEDEEKGHEFVSEVYDRMLDDDDGSR